MMCFKVLGKQEADKILENFQVKVNRLILIICKCKGYQILRAADPCHREVLEGDHPARK